MDSAIECWIASRVATEILFLPMATFVRQDQNYAQLKALLITFTRIWAAIKRETLPALSEGVATPEEIDAIFKDVLKTLKGSWKRCVVGLDIVLAIEEHYAEVRKGVP